jgi:hypothetical protein
MKYYAVVFDRITTRPYLASPLSTTLSHGPDLANPRGGQKDAVDYVGFHQDFIKPKAILKWWHYMESLYLIGTEWSSLALSEHFVKTAQAHGVPLMHMVLQVDLQSRYGFLHKDAWDWIDNEVRASRTDPTLPP